MTSILGSIRNSWAFRRLGLVNDDVEDAPSTELPGRQFTAALEPWEAYMASLQSIMIWEKPTRSIVALFVANLLFW